MRVRRRILATIAFACAAPATAHAGVATWQSCAIGPGGDTARCTSGRSPQQLTAAGDALWFTTASAEIGSVSAAPATLGAVTLHPIPPASASPSTLEGIAEGIVRGADGRLWFTEPSTSRIGQMTTAGAFSFTPLAPLDPALRVQGAQDIVLGPDGNFWLTRWPGAVVTRLTPTGATTDYPLAAVASPPGGVELQNIVNGPGGKLWFVRSKARRIDSITVAGAVAEFPFPAGVTVNELAAGPDGALWLSGETNAPLATRHGIVGRLAADGSYRLFDLGPFLPRAIFSDGDQLWLGSESVTGPGGVLRMTTGGTVTRYEPMLFQPDISAITKGPDGAIWFLDLSGAAVGRVDGSAAPATGAPTPVEIDPKSLAVTATGATVTLDASAAADVEVRAGVGTTTAAATALPKGTRRVRFATFRTVGRTTTTIGQGKKRVALRLSASTRRALRRGTRLKVAIRARESNTRKTVVQATLRARR